MSDVTEHNLTMHREDLEKMKDFAKAVERLQQNPDFKKVITDGFLTHEAARFAHASTDFNLNEEQRADALGSAQAGGFLKRFLYYSVLLGRQADSQMHQVDQELEEMRSNPTTH